MSRRRARRTTRRSWWRENRLWLAVLPLALAAATLASSYDLEFWWDNGLHREIAAGRPGEPLRVTDDYDDVVGPTSRTFEVELDSLRTVDGYPYGFSEPEPPPDGVDAVAVVLRWRAAPDQVLRGCGIALLDDEGRRYEVDTSTFVSPCVPEDHGGPLDAVADGDERGSVPEGEDRPPTWTTEPLVLVPHGREITQVLVWWERPGYVRLPVS